MIRDIRSRVYQDVGDYMATPVMEEAFRVLVPLDGSELAERALAYVPLLAPLGDLRPRLLGVVDAEEVGAGVDEDQYLERRERVLSAYLQREGERLCEGVPTVEVEVLAGDPAALILADASQWNADLIVISTHGRSGFERWRLGSVADKVIRGATCNALVIGPSNRTDAAPVVHSILVPLDGSPHAEVAIAVARRLADGLGAELHLLQVVTPVVMYEDVAGVSYGPDLTDLVIQDAKTKMECLKEQTRATYATVVLGAVAEGITAYIEDEGIDLVVMTSHGRGGMLRTALGSVTDRLIVGLAPVLVVNPH